jgi:hypothetical protein
MSQLKTNRTNSKWFVSEEMSDALHLWYAVILLEFVKKPGSLIYPCPVLLIVHYFMIEKRDEMKRGAGAEPVNWTLVCGYQDGIADSLAYAAPESLSTVQPQSSLPC